MLLRLTSRFRLTRLINSFSMDTPKTLAELQERSKKADDMIKTLKTQIEQIKLQSTPDFMSKREQELKNENEKLKKRVEELKKELESAEAANSAPATS